MKILVISSCTSKKLKREASAGKMYTGGQHSHLMEGLEKVRNSFGEQAIDLAIISAKHGLLSECDVIAPYNCTFQGLKVWQILERSDRLQLHERTKALITRYDLVFFLLGKEYVQALQLPFDVPDTVAQIFLLGPINGKLIPNLPNVYFIAAGRDLAKTLGVMITALKGVVFKKLCCVVCREGLEVFEMIRQDPQLVLELVHDGEG